MQLVDVLTENMVFLEFNAKDKDEAIDKFVQSVKDTGLIDEPKILKDALHERENLGTTGVGGGIAIPHARSVIIKDLTVGFFRSKAGLDFKAIDGKPVHIIFMLLAPLSSGGPYLKLLAKISRLLRSNEFRDSLMEAETPAKVVEIIQEYE